MNVVDVLSIDGISHELSKWMLPSSIITLSFSSKELLYVYIERIKISKKKQYYATSGNCVCEINYINEIKHGNFKRWYPDGLINIETMFVDGKKQGKHYYWFNNGQISKEIDFFQDKRHGMYHEYQKWMDYHLQVPYVNGVIHGEVIVSNRRNGETWKKITYENGKVIGTVGVCKPINKPRKKRFKYNKNSNISNNINISTGNTNTNEKDPKILFFQYLLLGGCIGMIIELIMNMQ